MAEYRVTIKRRLHATMPIRSIVVTLDADSEDEAGMIAWDQVAFASYDAEIADVEEV